MWACNGFPPLLSVISSDSDLRKALVRSRLAAAAATSAASAPGETPSSAPTCQRRWSREEEERDSFEREEELPRSDSMDSMLGDSLLDPPQCLQKIPPKRYQSPSRCGSPSVEAPEHLLFGRSKRVDYSSRRLTPASERCARQDLLRRRDINLYHGLHPRLLHHNPGSQQQQQQQPPRLSLPPGRMAAATAPRPCLPVRPNRALETPPVDDRMHVNCTIHGKHICSLDEDEAATTAAMPSSGEADEGVPETPEKEEEEEGEDEVQQQEAEEEEEEDWTHEYRLRRGEGRGPAAAFPLGARRKKRQRSLLDESGIVDGIDPAEETGADDEGGFLSDKFK